jgi:hypothetical protein
MNKKISKNETTILTNIKFIMATTKTTIKAIVAFKTITKNSNSSTQKRRISASDFSKSDSIYNDNNNQESSVPNDQLDSTQNKTAENDENDESDSGYNDNELTPRNKQQKTVKLKEKQKTVQLKDPSKDSKRKSSLPAKNSKKSPSSSNSNSRKSSIVSNGGGSSSGKSSRKSSTSKKSGGGLPSFMIPTASSLKKKEDAIAYQKLHGVEPGVSKSGKGRKGNRRTSAGDAIRRRKLARRRASIPPHLMITEASIIESLE